MLAFQSTSPLACSCRGKSKQTTATELRKVNVVIKGRVLNVSNYVECDTLARSLAGLRVDTTKLKYYEREYNLFKVAVDMKFKSPSTMPDTIYILTCKGDGDCGFPFEIEKEYIIYGYNRVERKVVTELEGKQFRRKLVETKSLDTYNTNICSLTQLSNDKELANLKLLTK